VNNRARLPRLEKGKGSQALRQQMIVKLLRGADDVDELQFLMRMLISNMRLGATMKSILTALHITTRAIETCHTIVSELTLDSIATNNKILQGRVKEKLFGNLLDTVADHWTL
jgi:ATP-dependent DNA ligase